MKDQRDNDNFNHYRRDNLSRDHLLNSDMQNKDFLQTLYDGTRHLGLVKSQYEFGHICGRNNSWFSCAKSVDRTMPLDALVILAVSLEQLIPIRLPKSRQSEAKKLVKNLWDIVRAAAEAQTDLRSLH